MTEVPEPNVADTKLGSESNALAKTHGMADHAENLKLECNAELERLGRPRFYVIVSHVAKRHNIGTMVRSANAFGVREILVAGSKKHTLFFGAQGTQNHVAVRYLPGIEACAEYARKQGAAICGVEIKDEALSILDQPWAKEAEREGGRRHTAFILGNEGEGMSEKACSVCDYFTYIPHYGDGIESLNVAVASAIVFQNFTAWARYPERKRVGEKYVVKELPQKRGATTEEDFAKQRMRREKKARLAAIAAVANGAEKVE